MGRRSIRFDERWRTNCLRYKRKRYKCGACHGCDDTKRIGTAKAARRSNRWVAVAQRWAHARFLAYQRARAGRCVFTGCGEWKSGTVDDERNSGEDGWVSRSGTGAMEEFRRKDNFRIFVQVSREVHLQASRAVGDPCRTGGAVSADFSRAQQLSAE